MKHNQLSLETEQPLSSNTDDTRTTVRQSSSKQSSRDHLRVHSHNSAQLTVCICSLYRMKSGLRLIQVMLSGTPKLLEKINIFKGSNVCSKFSAVTHCELDAGFI